MGLSASVLPCPQQDCLREATLGLNDEVQTILLRSISFDGKEVKTNLRSVSFKKSDSQKEMSSDVSGQAILKESLSFKNWQAEVKLETMVSFKKQEPEKATPEAPAAIKCSQNDGALALKPPLCSPRLASPRTLSPRDAAAVKLQKVYKSYRTRRNLADCAVVVEELWWKALDFATLKRNCVSYYNGQKPETAVSRWARARTKAAKVGKGLSKDEKAQKLALQHWLEAIDPRHRYGHNLHLYYDIWFESESSQPFFYWLDIGDGKEVNLEKCCRSVLHRQCIQYLGPSEREAYEVIVETGKLVYRQSGEFVSTDEESKWIFVLSTSRKLYVGRKKKGTFQHSSFLSGGATTSSGRLVAESGVLKAIWPYSGHYHPTEEHFMEFISFLQEQSVDLVDVKMYPTDGDSIPTKVVQKATEEEGVDVRGKGSKAPPKLQLGKPLSCKWSTGVGPRIGCVRDYPTDLQFRALEKVNLSPRVNPSPFPANGPIPSPRPSPKIRVSPRLSGMGMPSPRVVILGAAK